MTLGEFETGARVIKTNASPVDAAYASIGTVHREEGMVGVLWDSWPHHIVQYEEDQPAFELAPAGVKR